jgi:hypothetical protein
MQPTLTRGAAAVKKSGEATFAKPLALSRLVAFLRLVDDVDAAFATHEAVVAVAVTQGFQRITDFHFRHQKVFPRGTNPPADNEEALVCLKPSP